MIEVFYGDNRKQAQTEIRQRLGKNYEVIEGADLVPADLPSLLMGGSLFANERSILIRDLLANKSVAEELVKYLNTPHRVIILETKVDGRINAVKSLKEHIKFKEFKMPDDPKAGQVFNIYRTAKRDGTKAVKMLREIQAGQEPAMFLGLMVSQAVKDYGARPGAREKAALKNLSKLDMDLKSSKIQPWVLIEAFLISLEK